MRKDEGRRTGRHSDWGAIAAIRMVESVASAALRAAGFQWHCEGGARRGGDLGSGRWHGQETVPERRCRTITHPASIPRPAPRTPFSLNAAFLWWFYLDVRFAGW